MDNKNRIKWILYVVISILFVIGLSLSASAYVVISDGDFWLKADNQGADNYVFLQWEDVGTDHFYTIYQSADGGETWETRSPNYGRQISVLSIYPSADGNVLETWMVTNGYGRNLIEIDSIILSSYNANPDLYLLDSVTGEYKYDVVSFGFRDCNGPVWSTDYDLTETARNATEKYINSGYGVLFGHDTASLGSATQIGHPNFTYLAETYGAFEIATATGGESGNGQIPRLGNTQIEISNSGFLLQYPWTIEYDSGKTYLEIPLSHSYGQIANGTIWMKFSEPFVTSWPGPEIFSAGGGSNNFYLATYNNVAMIQTGHTHSSSTVDEQKIIANVLMYLAQYTENAEAEDRSAVDQAAPEKPSAILGNSVNERILSSIDKGTPYMYKIESVNKHNENDKKTSDIVEEYCTTGIYGYYIIEDKLDYLDFNIDPDTLIPAAGDGTLTYTMQNHKHYLHVKAVDYAGNISEPLLIPPFSITIEKTLDITAEQNQEFVFEIAYSPISGGAPENVYYTVVTVEAGKLTGTITLDQIAPGYYTITEQNNNWNYELDTTTPKSQELALIHLGIGENISYKNNFTTTNLIYGKSSTTNRLK